MPMINTEEGLPHGTKRPAPENFKDSPTKKAKSLDSQGKNASEDAVAEALDLKANSSETKFCGDEPINAEESPRTRESETTAGEKDSKKSLLNDVEKEAKDTGTIVNEVKPTEFETTENTTKQVDYQLNSAEAKTSESNGNVMAKGEKIPKDPEMSEDQETSKKPPAGYVMNVNGTLVEAHRGTPIRKLVNLPVTVLKGINEQQAQILDQHFKVKTVRDLANWKFYQIAKSMQALAEVEEIDGRLDTSLQNINDAVDKSFEKKSLSTIMDQKAEVLQGVGKFLQGQLSKEVGITTMKELANFKPAMYAAALVALADYETTGFESKTTANDTMPLSTFRPVVG